MFLSQLNSTRDLQILFFLLFNLRNLLDLWGCRQNSVVFEIQDFVRIPLELCITFISSEIMSVTKSVLFSLEKLGVKVDTGKEDSPEYQNAPAR